MGPTLQVWKENHPIEDQPCDYLLHLGSLVHGGLEALLP
jgi:hypothetical protein